MFVNMLSDDTVDSLGRCVPATVRTVADVVLDVRIVFSRFDGEGDVDDMMTDRPEIRRQATRLKRVLHQQSTTAQHRTLLQYRKVKQLIQLNLYTVFIRDLARLPQLTHLPIQTQSGKHGFDTPSLSQICHDHI